MLVHCISYQNGNPANHICFTMVPNYSKQYYTKYMTIIKLLISWTVPLADRICNGFWFAWFVFLMKTDLCFTTVSTDGK